MPSHTEEVSAEYVRLVHELANQLSVVLADLAYLREHHGDQLNLHGQSVLEEAHKASERAAEAIRQLQKII